MKCVLLGMGHSTVLWVRALLLAVLRPSRQLETLIISRSHGMVQFASCTQISKLY